MSSRRRRRAPLAPRARRALGHAAPDPQVEGNGAATAARRADSKGRELGRREGGPEEDAGAPFWKPKPWPPPADPPFIAYRPAFRARPDLRRGAGASSSGYLRKIPSWLNGSRRSDFRYAAIRGRPATRSRSATRRGIFRSSCAIAFGNA